MTWLALSTLQVSIVLGAALALVRLMRGRSAALRHWILAVAVACALAAPLLALLPRSIGVTPRWTTAIVDPGTIAAATSRGAADEKSPGTSSSSSRSTSAVSTETLPGRRVTRAPARSRSRSVWSRVGIGSTTVVVPAARRPASSTADFTCAEGTGSS